jgi:hypothetical protein
MSVSLENGGDPNSVPPFDLNGDSEFNEQDVYTQEILNDDGTTVPAVAVVGQQGSGIPGESGFLGDIRIIQTTEGYAAQQTNPQSNTFSGRLSWEELQP